MSSSNCVSHPSWKCRLRTFQHLHESHQAVYSTITPSTVKIISLPQTVYITIYWSVLHEAPTALSSHCQSYTLYVRQGLMISLYDELSSIDVVLEFLNSKYDSETFTFCRRVLPFPGQKFLAGNLYRKNSILVLLQQHCSDSDIGCIWLHNEWSGKVEHP